MNVFILPLNVVLIYTFAEKRLQTLCMVVDHLALGCHGNVKLEPNISLFLALVYPIWIIFTLYELSRCMFTETR